MSPKPAVTVSAKATKEDLERIEDALALFLRRGAVNPEEVSLQALEVGKYGHVTAEVRTHD